MGERTRRPHRSNPKFQAALSACQSLEGGAPPSPAQQAARMANALRFSRCMRSHGVFQAAQAACEKLLPLGARKGHVTGGPA